MNKILAFGLFLAISFTATSARADRVLNALSQLQKNEFSKAKELIDKELEKETQSAGAWQVLSLYYFSEKNPAYSIDSAYASVLKAIEFFPQNNPKDTATWAKKYISLSTAHKLKADIEAAAFIEAQKNKQITDVQLFIERFPTASEILQAIKIRNEWAWQNALQINTIEAYQAFLNNYPEAEQKNQAISVRDKLIFNQETQSARLSNYEKFISQYPDNQEVDKAIERIFFLKSLSHRLSFYEQFIQNFPQHPSSRKAWDWIGVLGAKELTINDFLNKYPDYPHRAVWEQLAGLHNRQFYPYLENESYGYLDEIGEKHIKAELDNVPKNHLCETIQPDYLIFQKNNLFGLMNKIGQILIPAQFDRIEALSQGLYRVSKNAQVGLYLQSGLELISPRFDLLEYLNPQFLKFRKNRRWGIVSVNGEMIIEPKFLEIEAVNEHFTAAREPDGYIIMPTESLIQKATEKIENFIGPVEKVDLAAPYFLKIEKDGKWGIFDNLGQLALGIDNQEVNYLSGLGWAIRKDTFWIVKDLNFQNLSETQFEKVISSSSLIGLKSNGKWGVMDGKGQLIKNFENDSLAFIGDILLLYKGKKITAEFTANPSAKLLDISLLRNIRAEKAEQANSPIWLYFEDAQRRKGLYDQMGQNILPPKYQNLYSLNDKYINIQLNNRFGLIDNQGKILLNPKYDGISVASANRLILLSNGKYGFFQTEPSVLIDPIYEVIPRFFGDSTQNFRFIVKKNGYYGVVDDKGKNILGFDFQAIEYWQDSLALVQQKSGQWIFYDFTKKALKNKINDTTKIVFEEAKIVYRSAEESIALVKQNKLYGFWSSARGEILPPTFEVINNMSKGQRPFFVAEQRKGRNRYQITYLNHLAKIIWQADLPEIEYFKLLCE
jgi:hypothetical protein